MSEDDPYGHVATGKLKLKGDSSIKKKKKKRDRKLKEEATRSMDTELADSSNQNQDTDTKELKRTKAEMAFQKMQEKNQTKRILEKACMTHKERVEKFNQHLDSLTEHFDIPKVSWTK